MPKRKMIGPCSVIGCGRPIETLTFCQKHYMRKWQFGRLHKVVEGNKRKHPLYAIWFDRKTNGVLCDEWLDFWKFVEGVGSKPGFNFFLVRKGDGPFSPTNFVWVEHLRRQKGETLKAWHARKWASRQLANPGIERRRSLWRKYKLTPEEYGALAAAQNNKCAICEEVEISSDRRWGGIKRLAVDHCHNTGKVRGLLCSRCNTTLGKIEESPQLIRAMWDYLHKHNSVPA